jgi:hypothetical protein
VDLIPANSAHLWDACGTEISPLPGIKPSDALNQEAIAIDSLTIEQYHKICYWNLSRHRNLYCPASATVTLSTIIACPLEDRLEDSLKIALLPERKVYLGDWRTAAGATGEVTDGGWTWYYYFILVAW